MLLAALAVLALGIGGANALTDTSDAHTLSLANSQQTVVQTLESDHNPARNESEAGL